MNFELSEHKQRVADVYDLAAPGYDGQPLRFFPLCAQHLVELAGLQRGYTVLDVGCGTGAAALTAARAVGAAGHVAGIDIAPDMLSRARSNANAASLTNIVFMQTDAEHLDYPTGAFDVVLSASSIFFLPDMAAALREWLRVARPGGRLAISGYGDNAFQPLSDLFEDRIRSYGIRLAASRRPFSWQRLTRPAQYRDLLIDAGCDMVEVHTRQLGYYLHDPDDWWDVVWNSGFRGPVSQLAPQDRERFRQEHLRDVSEVMTQQGIWLDITAIFGLGIVP